MPRANEIRYAPAVAFDSPGMKRLAVPPEGMVALMVAEWASALGTRGLLYVSRSESRARRVARAARGFAPDLEILVIPPWDCLPYDRASPSRAVMGERIAAMRRLATEPPNATGRLVLAPIDALLQRVPPRRAWTDTEFRIAVGEPLSLENLRVYLIRVGFRLDERVDEPGEAAIRGEVIDLFPGDAPQPYRLDIAKGGVKAIRRYDAYSQRTIGETDALTLQPVSEVLLDSDPVRRFLRTGEAGDSETGRAVSGPAEGILAGTPEAPCRVAALEHWLPRFYSRLEALFDYLPKAPIVCDAEVEARRTAALEQIADAHERRLALRSAERMAAAEEESERAAIAPDRLYLDEAAWRERLAGRAVLSFVEGADGSRIGAEPGPRFTDDPDRLGGFVRHVKVRTAAGDRVVLVAGDDSERRRLARSIERRLKIAVAKLERWDDVALLPDGAVASVPLRLDQGFTLPGLAVIAAADVDGDRELAVAALPRADGGALGAPDLRPGDLVVHLDHGIGVVRGLETVTDDGAREYLSLEYAAETKLLVRVEEMDLLWRYGSEDAQVALDRLNGDRWKRQRAEVEAQIATTARELVDLARRRRKATAPQLTPPREPYRRFVARFPYAETADQERAIEAVLKDLAGGHPMNRLVCGDVGYGKTEVALRAAAAVALAGKQVALAAPTTVLVRQHLQTFRDRFAGFGIRVERLSGAASGPDARAVKAGLADGSIDIVIGTHALASKGVRFNDLGLVILDEEQRFGAAHKERLKALGRTVHALTMTATPIPRTLQTALVGIQDLSIIATPPVRRQPIRTFVLGFDPVVVREAMLRERNRGGQSLVVCPRIEDLKPMAARLAELVPDLDVTVAHGRMKADALEDAMIGFVNGRHDVLLATNIIEAGLDIPGANTMLVWRADRFGLAQLHQLRGRVGRGRARGVAYLLLESRARLAPATEQRLRTLEALDSHGAGFAISARDLDLRGAGSLMGADQRGHVQLIGTELYQHLLARAIDAAHGKPIPMIEVPHLHLDVPSTIPADYVPEEEIRIGLYRRAARLQTEAQADELAEEIEDRFGPAPESVANMLRLACLRQHCRRLGIVKIEAGPQAMAVTLRDGAEVAPVRAAIAASDDRMKWHGDRLIYRKATTEPNDRLGAVEDLLRKFDSVLEQGRPVRATGT